MAAKMCPYNKAREVQHYEQTNMPLTDDGVSSGYTYTLPVDFIPLPCTEEKCGAWNNGHCGYSER